MILKDLLSNNLSGMLLRSWSRLPVIIDDFILRDSNGEVIYDTNGNCFTIGELPSNVLLDEYGEVILDINGDYITVA